MIRFTFAWLIMFFSTVAFADQETDDKIRNFDWKTKVGTYEVESAGAKITLSSNEYLLIGEDAQELVKMTEGHDLYRPDAVKIKVHPDQSETSMMYFWHEIGYVTTDDWDDLDTDELFQDIQSSTEKANEAREEGYTDVKVEGWAQTPFIDYQESIIYWAIKGHEVGGSNFINAQALKLGRKGFSVLIWTGDPDKFTSAQDVLAPELANYEYAQGLAYKDFVAGQDAVAALGVGALVYKLATGKTAAKAGFWALVAIFAKKFWYVLIFPLVWFWRRYFKK